MCTACNWGSSILHFSLPLLFFPLPSLHHITMYILYNYYKQDEAALRRAALSGDVAAVKKLVDSKVNINCTDEVSNITVSIHFTCKCVFLCVCVHARMHTHDIHILHVCTHTHTHTDTHTQTHTYTHIHTHTQ